MRAASLPEGVWAWGLGAFEGLAGVSFPLSRSGGSPAPHREPRRVPLVIGPQAAGESTDSSMPLSPTDRWQGLLSPPSRANSCKRNVSATSQSLPDPQRVGIGWRDVPARVAWASPTHQPLSPIGMCRPGSTGDKDGRRPSGTPVSLHTSSFNLSIKPASGSAASFYGGGS